MAARRAWRRAAAATIALGGLTLCLHAQATAPPAGASAAGPSAVVLVAEVDGIIHPVSAEFMQEVLTTADTTGARLVVFVLRTPGGLLDSTRDIVSRMITARTPVVVFVGPSGARAASAGFLLALAADVAVMAPGTHIGAAHPVSGVGQEMSDTASKKAAQDTAAYARTLAEARHRNVTLAAAAVTESRAFTDHEALTASPPLIDFIAPDVPAVIRALDGRTIARFDGRTVVLDTTNLETRRIEMSWRQRLLSTIAHPQVAYLLFSLGVLGLTVELWHPGAVLPGVVGALALLLAFFGLQVLSVGMTGVLLVVLGLALLVLELKVPGFGLAGIGGAIALVLGSIMMTRGVPGVEVSLGIVVPVALGIVVVFLFLGRLALGAQRLQPVSGAEGLIGTVGRTLAAIPEGQVGQARVHGEIWRAVAARPLEAGAPIRVIARDGLTLTVEPADGPHAPGGLPSC